MAENTFSPEEFYDFVPSQNFSYYLKPQSSSILVFHDPVVENMGIDFVF